MPRHIRPTTVYPMALRELEVLRVADVTPGMRRVTLTGHQLAAHTTPDGLEQKAFASTGFDDDVRLIFPYPGETEPVLPIIKDGGITFPKERKLLAKVYTVRSYDPERRELEIDFVKHGIGIATTWAYRAQPGDHIHVFGPAVSSGLPENADWLVVAGDDTAIPAIARLLEELPADARAQVFIEVAEEAHRQELRELEGVNVTWLARNGAEPGTTTLLLDAVRQATWWEGDAFAWIAGEQATVRDLRRHLIEERGLDKRRIDFTGYWKRQAVVALENDDAVPDPERNQAAFEKFHEMAELLPPMAIRVAANLDIADHISRGVTTVAALARATGADERALGKFLRYLHALELLEQSDSGEYKLSETGEFLTNEYVLDHLRHDGVTARQELGFYALEDAVRSGAPSYEKASGRSYPALREDTSFENKLLENTAEFARYLATPLAQAQVLSGAKHVLVHSNGAGAFAAALVSKHPQMHVTIAALPTAAAWFRADLPQSVPVAAQRERIEVIEQSLFESGTEADVVLLVKVLSDHRDLEAALILRRAAQSLAPGGRLVVIEDTLDETELDEHACEADLLALTLTGSGYRTDGELAQVFADAGLTNAATETVGWGAKLHLLTPTP
ncbi:MAG: siderophore-interacting protein [Ancrocorticia sp.]